jgi:sortase A
MDRPERDAAEVFTYDPPVSSKASPGGFLLDSLRRRPAGRALLSGLTVLLFLGGSGMFAYPFFTDLYTDQVIQGRLADEFGGIEVDGFEDWESSVSTGDALTRIAIPDIEVETLVVAGTSPAALRAGAGHYPSTVLPGQVGNVGIAGHRTTYGRPFNRLDELKRGAEIWLQTPIGDFRYVVVDPPTEGDCRPYDEMDDQRPESAACVTHPRDWSVVSESDEAVLTLTTCHPKGSAEQRMVVRAQLEESHDPGAYEQRFGDADGAAAA